MATTRRIKYVGTKEGGETAYSTLTGIARWMIGDVLDVDAKHVGQLLQHPDVFALADEPEAPTPVPAAKPLAEGLVAQGVAPAPAPAPSAAPPASAAASAASPSPPPGTEQTSITVNGEVKELDELGKAELHALAKELGVVVHHAAGRAKVIDALVAAFPNAPEGAAAEASGEQVAGGLQPGSVVA